jgi:2-C-methyl-D-erythritol 4-phosphate cytidylyltransferase
VLAGGSGTRVGADRNKVLLTLGGEPILRHSVRAATLVRDVRVVVVVVRPGDAPDLAGDWPVPVETAPGGATRHDSEWSALRHLRPRIESGEVDVVAVHDAARPLATVALWEAVVEAARKHGGALPARPAVGLVPREGGPPREDLVGVQTPQAFRAGPLLEAYAAAEREGFTGTDTAACVAAYTDLRLRAVPGEATNLKVTWPEDLPLAERLLRD